MGSTSRESYEIYKGLTNYKWPFLTPETIEGFIESPELLDWEWQDFVEGFFKCYSEYWRSESTKSS